jgi:hypothetical protein
MLSKSVQQGDLCICEITNVPQYLNAFNSSAELETPEDATEPGTEFCDCGTVNADSDQNWIFKNSYFRARSHCAFFFKLNLLLLLFFLKYANKGISRYH